jgi:hypothetical protein
MRGGLMFKKAKREVPGEQDWLSRRERWTAIERCENRAAGLCEAPLLLFLHPASHLDENRHQPADTICQQTTLVTLT